MWSMLRICVTAADCSVAQVPLSPLLDTNAQCAILAMLRNYRLPFIIACMWTKQMSGPRKKAPRTIAVIDPDRCFGAFACSICQAACPVAGCVVEEPDRDGRMVCAVRADLCIGCGLCVTLGNPTAPQQREFGCPPD